MANGRLRIGWRDDVAYHAYRQRRGLFDLRLLVDCCPTREPSERLGAHAGGRALIFRSGTGLLPMTTARGWIVVAIWMAGLMYLAL